MSFYGNITNTSRAPFTFDRIYSSRHAMEANREQDGVYAGRFVLVEYDKAFSHEEFRQAYRKSNETTPEETTTLYKDAECQVPVIVQQDGNLGDLTAPVKGDIFYVVETTTFEKQVYWISDSDKEKITLDQSEATAQYYVILDNTKVYFNNALLAEQGIILQENQNTINNTPVYRIVQNGYSFYECTGAKGFVEDVGEEDYTASFKYLALSHENPKEGSIDNYLSNHALDIMYYDRPTGYDSTVWQKVYVDGQEQYIMVADLNSTRPMFTASADAPSSQPSVPHFDIASTTTMYDLHQPTQWGFRVKSANNALSSLGMFDSDNIEHLEKLTFNEKSSELLSNYVNSLQFLQEVYCADVKTLQETYGVQVEKIRDSLRSQLETAFTANGLTKDYVNVFMNQINENILPSLTQSEVGDYFYRSNFVNEDNNIINLKIQVSDIVGVVTLIVMDGNVLVEDPDYFRGICQSAFPTNYGTVLSALKDENGQYIVDQQLLISLLINNYQLVYRLNVLDENIAENISSVNSDLITNLVDITSQILTTDSENVNKIIWDKNEENITDLVYFFGEIIAEYENILANTQKEIIKDSDSLLSLITNYLREILEVKGHITLKGEDQDIVSIKQDLLVNVEAGYTSFANNKTDEDYDEVFTKDEYKIKNRLVIDALNLSIKRIINLLIYSDANTYWLNVQNDVNYYYDGEEQEWKLSEDYIKPTVPADIYFNRRGFDKNVRHRDEDFLEDKITITPTGYGQRLNKNGQWENFQYNKENRTVYGEKIESPDTQELSIKLPSIGNTISDIWDIVYTEDRVTDLSWENGSMTKPRMVYEKADGNGFEYDTAAVTSLAGVINSTQDLMGRIIVDVNQQPGFEEMTPNAVPSEVVYGPDFDNQHIYYFNNDDSGFNYYRKKWEYNFDNIDANDIITKEDEYVNKVQGYTPVTLVNPTKMPLNLDNHINNTYFYKSEFDYLYDTAYDKSRSYFVITEIDDDPFRVDVNREYIVHQENGITYLTKSKTSEYDWNSTYYDISSILDATNKLKPADCYLWVPNKFYTRRPKLDEFNNQMVDMEGNPLYIYSLSTEKQGFIPEEEYFILTALENGDSVETEDGGEIQLNNNIKSKKIENISSLTQSDAYLFLINLATLRTTGVNEKIEIRDAEYIAGDLNVNEVLPDISSDEICLIQVKGYEDLNVLNNFNEQPLFYKIPYTSLPSKYQPQKYFYHPEGRPYDFVCDESFGNPEFQYYSIKVEPVEFKVYEPNKYYYLLEGHKESDYADEQPGVEETPIESYVLSTAPVSSYTNILGYLHKDNIDDFDDAMNEASATLSDYFFYHYYVDINDGVSKLPCYFDYKVADVSKIETLSETDMKKYFEEDGLTPKVINHEVVYMPVLRGKLSYDDTIQYYEQEKYYVTNDYGNFHKGQVWDNSINWSQLQLNATDEPIEGKDYYLDIQGNDKVTFYAPGKYYFKYQPNVYYIEDTANKYYKLDEAETLNSAITHYYDNKGVVDVKFYEPNKYYYEVISAISKDASTSLANNKLYYLDANGREQVFFETYAANTYYYLSDNKSFILDDRTYFDASEKYYNSNKTLQSLIPYAPNTYYIAQYRATKEFNRDYKYYTKSGSTYTETTLNEYQFFGYPLYWKRNVETYNRVTSFISGETYYIQQNGAFVAATVDASTDFAAQEYFVKDNVETYVASVTHSETTNYYVRVGSGNAYVNVGTLTAAEYAKYGTSNTYYIKEFVLSSATSIQSGITYYLDSAGTQAIANFYKPNTYYVYKETVELDTASTATTGREYYYDEFLENKVYLTTEYAANKFYSATATYPKDTATKMTVERTYYSSANNINPVRLEVYAPNKYYIQDTSTHYIIDTSSTFSSSKVYYIETEEKQEDGSYKKPVTLSANPQIANGDYIIGATYYEDQAGTKPIVLYPYKIYTYYINTGTNVEFIKGAQLVSETTLMALDDNNIPIHRTYYLAPLFGFSRNYNTIHGLILALNNLIELNDSQTRDMDTVMGTLNTLKDEIRRLGAYDYGVVQDMGKMVEALTQKISQLIARYNKIIKDADDVGGWLTRDEADAAYLPKHLGAGLDSYDYLDLNQIKLRVDTFEKNILGSNSALDDAKTDETQDFFKPQYTVKDRLKQLTEQLNALSTDVGNVDQADLNNYLSGSEPKQVSRHLYKLWKKTDLLADDIKKNKTSISNLLAYENVNFSMLPRPDKVFSTWKISRNSSRYYPHLNMLYIDVYVEVKTKSGSSVKKALANSYNGMPNGLCYLNNSHYTIVHQSSLAVSQPSWYNRVYNARIEKSLNNRKNVVVISSTHNLNTGNSYGFLLNGWVRCTKS